VSDVRKTRAILWLGPPHAVPSAAKAARCNDNCPVCRLVTASQLAPRRVLVCGWRQVAATGRLECFWQVVAADDSARAEAPGNELDDWTDALVGRRLHGRQAAVPVGGVPGPSEHAAIMSLSWLKWHQE
jgi:hypothetical protein